MKIVINSRFGGWSLSEKAGNELGIHFEPITIGGKTFDSAIWRDVSEGQLKEHGYSRTHPKVIELVERMGKDASGTCADLKVIEIPDGVEWTVEEYDGFESIHEAHQVWS